MVDIVLNQQESVQNAMQTRYRDMGDGTHALVIAAGGAGASNPVAFNDSWRVGQTQNRIVNDSDKTFTVPASTEWQILWAWVEYTSTVAVGNRQLVVEIRNAAGNVIGQVRAGATQAASLTRRYMFGAALPDLVVFRDADWLAVPIPPGLILQAGDQVRFYDNNAVAVAADDMVVQMQIAARTV